MEFLSLEPLLWLAALIAVAAGLRYTLVDRPRTLMFAATACRALGIALLVLALCRPNTLGESQDLHVVFLVDVSESVDLDAARRSIDDLQQAIDSLGSGDSWSLFAIGAEARPMESVDQLTQLLDDWRTGLPDARFRGASRLSQAILETRLAFPAGKARRVVLFSDGQETDGDIAQAIDQLAEEGADLLLRRVEGLLAPEAGVTHVRPSSRTAFEGEMLRMEVRLASNRPINAELRMVHNGVVVDRQPVVLSDDKPTIATFDVPMTTPGQSAWTAELSPDEDHFPLNNQASCTVNVRGKPRLLVLHSEPSDMRSFSRALQEQDLEVDVRTAAGAPNTLAEALAFDAIVLSDLPATSMSQRQMEMLKAYVIDYGGGLVMLGSEDSFGLGGYYRTPVEEVLPLVSRFEKEKEKPSLAMVLVIDKSGSMQGTPIALARQAAKAAVELLSARDLIGVVGFDHQAQLICELRSAGEVDSVQASIDSLMAGGGTFMYPGMLQAKEMLDTAPAKIRHMILLSDGHTQPADHESLAQDAVDSGITLSTVALGSADKSLLSQIAQIGRGRYYETNDPTSVPQIFTKETMQASKSAIKEDLFAAVRTGDHPLLAGVNEDDLPFSLGYVMTEPKPTAQLLLAAETGDPLLAIGRYGLGAGMAFTSDLTERWGGEWLAWDDCGRFWAQALRSVLRRQETRGLMVEQDVSGDRWTVDIRRTEENGQPVTGVRWEASLADEYNSQTPLEVEEVGLGRYRVTAPLDAVQNASLRLHDQDFDQLKVLHWRRPYPREYALAQKLPDAVAKLAELTPAAIHESAPSEPIRRPIASHLSLAALGLLLVGILLRRV